MLKLPRRKFLHLAAVAAALPTVPRIAQAQAQPQAWPTKQIRAISQLRRAAPSTSSRALCSNPSRQLGHAMVIDNRAGAGATVGAAAVARAEPDGYTLMVNSSAHAATPAIYPNAPYDTAQRLCGRCRLRQFAQRHRRVARRKDQDAAGVRRRCQAKPGSIHLALSVSARRPTFHRDIAL